jgi:hypothetical protein
LLGLQPCEQRVRVGEVLLDLGLPMRERRVGTTVRLTLRRALCGNEHKAPGRRPEAVVREGAWNCRGWLDAPTH